MRRLTFVFLSAIADVVAVLRLLASKLRILSRGFTGKMGRSSGPEVSITNFGDCKRVHRESVRFVREFSWFVFVPFPTI